MIDQQDVRHPSRSIRRTKSIKAANCQISSAALFAASTSSSIVPAIRINVDDLRTVTNRLFDHLDSLGERTVELDQDYYWIIGEQELYDPTRKPTDFVLGQLTDDWRELSKLLEGQKPISYSLVWLASILRAIGQKVVP